MKQLNAVVAFFASLSLIFNSQHLVAANTNQDKQSQVIGQANTLFRGLGTYQNLIKYLKPRVESIDQKTLADIEKTLRPNEKLPTIESKGNEVRFSNFKAPTLVEDFKNSIFSLNGKKWQITSSMTITDCMKEIEKVAQNTGKTSFIFDLSLIPKANAQYSSQSFDDSLGMLKDFQKRLLTLAVFAILALGAVGCVSSVGTGCVLSLGLAAIVAAIVLGMGKTAMGEGTPEMSSISCPSDNPDRSLQVNYTGSDGKKSSTVIHFNNSVPVNMINKKEDQERNRFYLSTKNDELQATAGPGVNSADAQRLPQIASVAQFLISVCKDPEKLAAFRKSIVETQAEAQKSKPPAIQR